MSQIVEETKQYPPVLLEKSYLAFISMSRHFFLCFKTLIYSSHPLKTWNLEVDLRGKLPDSNNVLRVSICSVMRCALYRSNAVKEPFYQHLYGSRDHFIILLPLPSLLSLIPGPLLLFFLLIL